jgi:hypothetical protein
MTLERSPQGRNPQDARFAVLPCHAENDAARDCKEGRRRIVLARFVEDATQRPLGSKLAPGLPSLLLPVD